jgi:signal peptidase I
VTYTIAILSIFLLIWILSLGLNAFFLLLGLRWAKVEEANFRRAFKASIVMFLVAIILVLGQRYFYGSGERPVAEELVILAMQIVGLLVVTRLFFGTGMLRSFQATLPLFAAGAISLAFAALIFVPFIADAFVVPTGSMAPTILGRHIEARCKTCDQPTFVSASHEHVHSQQESHGICVNFHSNTFKDNRGMPNEGDRILNAKFLAPQRWDVAVFKLPSDPNINYVKRVVGLPGETIYSDSSGSLKAINGTKDNPAALGPDEYFMLGDNTERALDARHWKTGAPGRQPYAVPKSYIEGVVTTIYWPVDRWRSFK